MLKRNSFVFCLAAMLSIIWQPASAAPGDVLETLTINNTSGDGRNPVGHQGIVTHDGYLWILDYWSDRIYRVYPEAVLDEDGFTVLHSAGDSDFNIPIPDNATTPQCLPAGESVFQVCGGGSLTFAQNFFWNASPVTDDIIKLDPADGDNLETENTLDTVPFPSPLGITYDGTYFWIVDWQSNTINKVLPETGAVLDTIPGPSALPACGDVPFGSATNCARPFGIAWDGQALWVSEQEEDRIYRVGTDGTVLNYFASPGTEPRDLAWDGEFLWHVDQGDGSSSTIYKIESGVIPFGLIGCVQKNGIGVQGNVLLSQNAVADQSSATDSDGCFVFANFESGVPLQVQVSESGVDEKPVLSLIGGDVTLIVGDTYSDPGVTALDTEDGDISTSVIATPDVFNIPTLIDTSAPSPAEGYTITYDVIDSIGNAADSITRTVYVLEVDVDPPVITLNGDNPMYVEQASSYVEPGATAMDTRDGDITADITITGSVNAAVSGSYTLSYDVTDSTGNAATTVTRTVIVQDTTAPSITLLGTNPMTVERGTPYTEPGATASDNIDGDISGSIAISGTVSTDITGSYIVTYNVSDLSGNAATTVTRTVNVSDTAIPVITLIGPSTYAQELNTTYVEPGYTATDSPSIDLTGSVVVSGSVNTSVAGTYVLSYDVTDVDGNAATTVTRTVVVADTTAPVLTINGDNPLTQERGVPYVESGATAVDAVDGDISGTVVIGGDTVDSNVPGTYSVTYDVSDAAGNASTTQTRIVNVSDTTPPVITLTGSPVIQHEQSTPYSDAGATASDNIDGNISGAIVTTGAVFDTSVVGDYTVTYNVSDSSGNAAAPVTRLVEVADRTIPVITLLGDNPYSHESGTVFVDPGATALDNIDGDISGSITTNGTVNASVPGTYNINYNVTDSSGNSAVVVTRVVNVADTGAPVINLNGPSVINHEINTTYTDAGATASDATDDDATLTANIVVTGSVDSSTAGTYVLTYNVTDSQGNAAATVTRTVNVGDFTKPVITLIGAATINHEQGTVYTDQGATAIDNVDGTLTSNIVKTGSVAQNTAGNYVLNYNVSDNAGNAADTVIRTVIVADTIAPVITLNGSASITIERGTTYNDAGASASDSFDGDLTTSITTVNPVDTLTSGIYTITYNVSDAAGNAATQVSRTVTVQDTVAPILTLVGSANVSHQQGDAYVDAGATAQDLPGEDISGSIVVSGTVDVNVPGSYVLTYNVTDIAGNAAPSITRTVTVADTRAPTITLNGSANVNVEQGTSYTDAGATASDTVDGAVAVTVGGDAVDPGTAGTYVITYDAVDAAGNIATQVTRTVVVADTIIPTITLSGDASIDLPLGDLYVEPGYTATDNIDGVITGNVQVSGTVDINTEGTYVLSYNVVDAGGNAAVTQTRTVNVVNPTVISIEAETATIGGAHTVEADITNNSGFTGSGYIQHSGEGYVEYTFDAFAVPYDLTVRYAWVSGDRPLEVIFNGQLLVDTISFPPTATLDSWSDTAAYTLTPESGVNTLRLVTTGSSGANLDSLTLTPQ